MSQEQTKFWTLSEDSGKLNPEILDIYHFLSERGFRKRTIADEIEIYRQNGHFVYQTFTSDKINEVTGYLQDEFKQIQTIRIDFPRKGPQLFEYTPKDILEKLVKYGWGRIFNENNCNHLPEMDIEIKKHTRDKAFFYFKNGFVEVTKNGCKLLPYDAFNGKYVFKDYLINREIKILNPFDSVDQDYAPKGVKFLDFLHRIAGLSFVTDTSDNFRRAKQIAETPEQAKKEGIATAEQAGKFQYLMKLIGFLLHDYKQQGLTDFCAILCDDNTGGSGKGVLIQALQELTALCVLDCRKDVGNYDPDKLTERTRIKVYNDVQPSFNFGLVYNEITDGGTIRHMYGSPRAVPYVDSWKVLLTSNYIIRGNSGPDQRRQRVFSMFPFFDKDLSIQDYYKHSFFSTDWQQEDWNFFYNVMFFCVQTWLSSEYKASYVDRDYLQRKMEAEFPSEFREYVDGLQRGMFHKTNDLYTGFKEHHKYKNTPFARKLTSHFFASLLKKYLEEMRINYKKNHNRTEIYIEKNIGNASR